MSASSETKIGLERAFPLLFYSQKLRLSRLWLPSNSHWENLLLIFGFGLLSLFFFFLHIFLHTWSPSQVCRKICLGPSQVQSPDLSFQKYPDFTIRRYGGDPPPLTFGLSPGSITFSLLGLAGVSHQFLENRHSCGWFWVQFTEAGKLYPLEFIVETHGACGSFQAKQNFVTSPVCIIQYYSSVGHLVLAVVYRNADLYVDGGDIPL